MLLHSLNDIQESATLDHQTFGDKLEIFSEHLTALASSREEFTETSSNVEKALLEQISAGETLKAIFEAIKEWKMRNG